MNVKIKALTAGVLFFMGGATVMAQKKDSVKDEKSIDEVVIVGFGQKKSVKEVTGAVSSLKSDAIQDVPVASIDKMLQGRVTGVMTGNSSGQPGGMASVRVRGISSINGVVSPIYILDGVRIANGDLTTANTTANILANLNPDDVESVTILKDAVSTAVYGADAGAGVVVINTKSGKKGKPRFNFSFNYGFNDKAVKQHERFKTADWLTYLADAYNNRYATSYTGDTFATALGVNKDIDSDWAKTVQKLGYQQNADFSMSGGNDRMTYYTSANYFNQESIVRNSYFNRLAFTNKIAYQATDKFKLTTDIQFSYSKLSTLSEGGAFANPILAQYFNRPTDPTKNPDGSWYWIASTGRLSNGMFNPGAVTDMNYSNAGTFRTYANLGLEYKILKNLTYKFVFSPEYIQIEEDRYWNPIHGDGRNYGGYQRTSNNRYFNFNVQNILDYNYKLGLHNFGASLIQEAYKTDNRFLSATGITVGTPTLQTLSNFVVPFGYAGSSGVSSRYGYAATGHYDYDKLVLLDASYRRDVLSQFMPENKAGNFWSVGVGLDLARLNFVKNINAISMFKLRSSYGKLGNQVSANPYALYNYNTNYNDYAAATYSGVMNPNLRWETVNPFNVGIDIGLFNDRITLSAEYFNKKTKDLIYNLPLQTSQGLVSYPDNIGSLVNKGYEFAINTVILKGNRDDIRWTLGFNLSTLDNEITELYGGNVNGSTTTLRVGEGVRTWYLRKWAGVDAATGAPLWYINGVDGATTSNYNTAQQAVQGSMLNKVYGGANTSISYKGFALDLQFAYGFGSKIYDDWALYTYSDGQYTVNYPGYGEVFGDYWTPTNTGASNPKPMYGNTTLSNRASTRFLYDGDYIRLSNAKFSYTFNGDFLKGSGLNSVQVYVMANNAYTYLFDKKLKFDPEVNIAGASNLGLPILKSYLFGFSLNF
ncbi:SusC/RagA family TonB-linked outer membrane protein [Cloacibacterium rupense]|nr:SusC/RagA family TonB-linked outer membrane protein [Cloacibacterium rupense]